MECYILIHNFTYTWLRHRGKYVCTAYLPLTNIYIRVSYLIYVNRWLDKSIADQCFAVLQETLAALPFAEHGNYKIFTMNIPTDDEYFLAAILQTRHAFDIVHFANYAISFRFYCSFRKGMCRTRVLVNACLFGSVALRTSEQLPSKRAEVN